MRFLSNFGAVLERLRHISGGNMDGFHFDFTSNTKEFHSNFDIKLDVPWSNYDEHS